MTPVDIGDTQGTLQARETFETLYKHPETLVGVYIVINLVLITSLIISSLQLVHDMHATEIFGIQPTCKLSLFFMKMSKLVGYFYYL